MGRNPQAGGRRGGSCGERRGDLVGAQPDPALLARAASPPARASSGLPSWPAMLGRMGGCVPIGGRWSLTRAWPSGRCASAWASWRPGASSGSVTRTSRWPGSSADRRPKGEPPGSHPGPRRLTDTEMAALERQFPGLDGWVAVAAGHARRWPATPASCVRSSASFRPWSQSALLGVSGRVRYEDLRVEAAAELAFQGGPQAGEGRALEVLRSGLLRFVFSRS
jgi:hypothetical protein